MRSRPKLSRTGVLLLLSGLGGTSTARSAAHGAAVFLVVGHAGEFCTGGLGVPPPSERMLFKFLFGFVVVDVEREQGLRGHVVFVFQNGEEKVFGADDGTLESLGLEVGDLQESSRPV